MSRKIFLFFSAGMLVWSTKKLYVNYQYFEDLSQMRQKYQIMLLSENKKQEHVWDGSYLVRFLLHHAQKQDLTVHKIEPDFSNQFNVVMEGRYMHFVKWIADVCEEKPQIHWLKITIRKVTSDKQRYILNGVYSA
ncbi:MAG: hypothetical protein EBQ95_04175 [Gammaproteobacteria bacterium]|nr:hypothetical protein [Gammaproteobacteria bacterium]